MTPFPLFNLECLAAFLCDYSSYTLETRIDSIASQAEYAYQISSRSLNSFLVFFFLAMSVRSRKRAIHVVVRKNSALPQRLLRNVS